MDAKKVSIISMIAASSCCLPPLILLGLTLIGVGTAGFAGISSTMGSLKWYIFPLAIVGVASSYYLYFKERKKCASQACKMVNETFTRFMLTFSTVVVLGFLVWSVYPYLLGTAPLANASDTPTPRFAVYSIDGMTCGGCEIAVDAAVESTGLVDSVKSSFIESKAYVWFKGEPNLDSVTKAIASVGYEAKPDTISKEQNEN